MTTGIEGFDVNVLNPPEGTGTMAGKGKTPPRGRDGKFRKSGRGGKGRKGNPSKRRGGGGRRGGRRRGRRRNPEGGGGSRSMTLASAVKDFWPEFLGTLFVVWAVRRWGGQGSVWPNAPQFNSPFAGRSWTMGNYIVGYIALKLAASALYRMRGARWAVDFYRGGVKSMLKKLVWTEGFARSPWLQQQFGAHGAMGQLVTAGPLDGMPMGQVDGQVMQLPNGQTMMWLNGQWNALQGNDAFGQLVTAGPLDADLTEGMGHQMTRATPVEEALRAAYQGTGAVSPYATAYQT